MLAIGIVVAGEVVVIPNPFEDGQQVRLGLDALGQENPASFEGLAGVVIEQSDTLAVCH